MKKLSRFSAVAVAVLICVNLPNAAAQADAWSVTGQGSPDGTMVAAITEGADYAGVSRRIINYRDSAGVPVEYLCLEGPTAEGDCSLQEPGSIFYSSSVLPFCASNAQTDCVETLLYGTTDSDLKKASFVREIAGQTYPAIPENGGAPAGGTTDTMARTLASLLSNIRLSRR